MTPSVQDSTELGARPAGERPSKCAEAARRAELERVAAMSPRERMVLALELGQRARHFRSLFTARTS